MKKAIDIKQDLDQDLFVDILAHDRDHIDRAKAKAERVKAEAQARRRAAAAEARATRQMEITASLAVCAVGVWTFLTAMLA